MSPAPHAKLSEYVVVRHGHDGGLIPDYHEPVWLGKSVIRDRRGRPNVNAGTRFAQVECNNPECKFEVLVNAEAVASVTRIHGEALR